jgi:Saxitoxin biosynthesis operon protein SxtJ
MSAHENSTSFDDRALPSLKSFGLTFVVVFAIIGLWPVLRHSAPPRYWSLAIAAAFLAVTFIMPQLLAPLNKLWFAFGLLLHKVVNPLILGLMFLVLLTPLALVMRLFGKRFLPTGFDTKVSTYWIPRNPAGPDPHSIRNQF